MSAPLTRIDHVGVVVRDADDSIAWYSRRFGMTVDADEVDSQGVRLVFLVPGAGSSESTAIQLLAPSADGAIARHLAEHGEGLHHICFAVPDIAAALAAAGDTTTEPFVGGKGRRCAFPEGVPSGVRLELVEVGS